MSVSVCARMQFSFGHREAAEATAEIPQLQSQPLELHNTLNTMVCYIMCCCIVELQRQGWCAMFSLYVQLLLHMPVALVCLRSRSYCATANELCWFQCCCWNSSREEPGPLGERRRSGWTGFFLCIVAGGTCVSLSLLCLSWRQSYVRAEGESSHRPALFLFFSMSQCLPAEASQPVQ